LNWILKLLPYNVLPLEFGLDNSESWLELVQIDIYQLSGNILFDSISSDFKTIIFYSSCHTLKAINTFWFAVVPNWEHEDQLKGTLFPSLSYYWGIWSLLLPKLLSFVEECYTFFCAWRNWILSTLLIQALDVCEHHNNMLKSCILCIYLLVKGLELMILSLKICNYSLKMWNCVLCDMFMCFNPLWNRSQKQGGEISSESNKQTTVGVFTQFWSAHMQNSARNFEC
jgi:hypothetical protein